MKKIPGVLVNIHFKTLAKSQGEIPIIRDDLDFHVLFTVGMCLLMFACFLSAN